MSPHGVSLVYCYFCTVAAGHDIETAKKGWDVMFDVFPADDNIIGNMAQSKLTVLAPSEEESAEQIMNSPQADVLQEIMSADKQKLTPPIKSQQDFMNLSTETSKAATSFDMFWGKVVMILFYGRF